MPREHQTMIAVQYPRWLACYVASVLWLFRGAWFFKVVPCSDGSGPTVSGMEQWTVSACG